MNYEKTFIYEKLCIILLLLCTQVANSFPTVTEINPTIFSLMQQVNIDSLEAKIRYLQNLGPRPRGGMVANGPIIDSLIKNNIAAKNWLYQQYENIDNLEVYFNHFLPNEPFNEFYDSAMNVVAVQRGTVYPDEFIIVCSHFDSFANGVPNHFLNSPGADDNASGTSGVLEIARVLSHHTFKRSIIYLNVNGHEMGIWGAPIFAHFCRENDINILGVFNLDMIGYNPIDKPLKMFYDNGRTLSKEIANYFDDVANLYLPDIPTLPTLNPSTDGASGGEEAAFTRNDYPAMYIGHVKGRGYENYGLNPCYHTTCDTIGIGKADAGVNSMELVRAYTQATLAAIAELAELDFDSIEYENLINCFLSPNPTNSTITMTLHLKDVGNLTVTLNNILGQELFEIYSGFANAGNFTKTFSVEALPKGVYYLKISHNGKMQMAKVIKK